MACALVEEPGVQRLVGKGRCGHKSERRKGWVGEKKRRWLDGLTESTEQIDRDDDPRAQRISAFPLPSKTHGRVGEDPPSLRGRHDSLKAQILLTNSINFFRSSSTIPPYFISYHCATPQRHGWA